MKLSLHLKAHSVCIIALLVSVSNLLSAAPVGDYVPLYAGTQLAFYPVNAAPGHISVQPYLFYIQQYGTYNSKWSEKNLQKTNGVTCLFALETGITRWLDVSLYLNGGYRKFGNEHTWIPGDTGLYFGFQILRDNKEDWTPDLRLVLGETFPTGKYQHLNPRKGGSDIFGTGAYVTTAILILAKTFYTDPRHPYNLNLNLYYIQPSGVPIHGTSLYGGSSDTRGRAFPNSGFITNLAIEYSLNMNWALGMDIRYVHQNKTTFKGNKGFLNQFGLPSSEQFSLAPCIEYSWSYYFSTAIGPWFSIAGRNSSAFFGVIGNIYAYF